MGVTTEEFNVHVTESSPQPDAGGGLAWDRLAALAEERQYEAGQVLSRQFAPATHLHLVADGAVQFQNRIEEGNEDIDVGHSRAAWTPVGWSGFLTPRRYSTTVVCETACRTLRFSHEALAAICSPKTPRWGPASWS